ncbi:MAG: hypothetical protein KDE27_18135, partial [Planctomycetes bacterium]|nr:hypothetical protein [Planctomycetota bacterium]
GVLVEHEVVEEVVVVVVLLLAGHTVSWAIARVLPRTVRSDMQPARRRRVLVRRTSRAVASAVTACRRQGVDWACSLCIFANGPG